MSDSNPEGRLDRVLLSSERERDDATAMQQVSNVSVLEESIVTRSDTMVNDHARGSEGDDTVSTGTHHDIMSSTTDHQPLARHNIQPLPVIMEEVEHKESAANNDINEESLAGEAKPEPVHTDNNDNSLASESSPEAARTKEVVSAITHVPIYKPLILTAEPHVPTAGVIVDVDETAHSDTDTISPLSLSASPAHHTEFHHHQHRTPTAHSQAPPNTPGSPATHSSLSTPTLPSLHQTSVPVLIEQYRQQRRADHVAFDNRTRDIKSDLVEAKVLRGGSDVLFAHEYTAELASRLDAEAIERWSLVRLHDLVHVDTDDEDKDEEEW